MKSVKLLPKTVLFASSLAVIAFVPLRRARVDGDNPSPTTVEPRAASGSAGPRR